MYCTCTNILKRTKKEQQLQLPVSNFNISRLSPKDPDFIVNVMFWKASALMICTLHVMSYRNGQNQPLLIRLPSQWQDCMPSHNISCHPIIFLPSQQTFYLSESPAFFVGFRQNSYRSYTKLVMFNLCTFYHLVFFGAELLMWSFYATIGNVNALWWSFIICADTLSYQYMYRTNDCHRFMSVLQFTRYHSIRWYKIKNDTY